MNFFWRLLTLVFPIVLILSLSSKQGYSQQSDSQKKTTSEDTNPTNGLYLGMFYGIHWPGADMADRFGQNFSIGGNFEFLADQKWIYGVEGQFLFGNEVKENVAGEIVDDKGRLIDANYQIAEIDVKERGINLFAKFGRIHDLWSERNISGIKWTVGAGWAQHKIRLKDSSGSVPFFNDDYIKGYDRLSGGFALTEFLGYQYLEERGRLNLFIGTELTQAFTKNQRGYNYSTKEFDTESRFDLLIGLKAGIQITIKTYRDPVDIWY